MLVALFAAIFAAPASSAPETPQSPPSAVTEAIAARAGQPRRGRRRRLYQRHPGARLQSEQRRDRSLCLVPLEDTRHQSVQDHGVHKSLHVGQQCSGKRSTSQSRKELYSITPLSGSLLHQVPARKNIRSTRRSPDGVDGRHGLRRRQSDLCAGWRASGDARPGDHLAGFQFRRAHHACRPPTLTQPISATFPRRRQKPIRASCCRSGHPADHGYALLTLVALQLASGGSLPMSTI